MNAVYATVPNMDECFALLQYAISQEVKETKTRIYSYDPLRELADRLNEKMKDCGWDVTESSCMDLTQQNAPSTSDAKDNSENAIDTRIRYSRMLTLIFNKLSSEIKQTSKRTSDPMTVLSVERIALLTSALQFYIPTAVLPYIDEGVGFGVEQRCKIIKYWQPLRDDDNFRRKQLLDAAKTFMRLSKCCPQMSQLIATKFLGDFVGLNEQLLNLNETTMKNHYENFIMQYVRRPDLIYQFLSTMKPLSASHKRLTSPRWFTMALGRRISEMIMETDGIANLTTALTQYDACFENSTFVQSLADVISRRPQFLKEGDPRRTLYHANILKQFIAVMERHPAAARVTTWFAATVEAIAALVPRTVAICFADHLLHPWEILLDRNGKMHPWTEGWSRHLDNTLKVLLFYVGGISPAATIQAFARMKKLFHLWLSLLGSGLCALEQIADTERRNVGRLFTDDLCQLLRRILMDPSFESDTQKAEFLLDQVMAEDIQMHVEFVFEAFVVELNNSTESGTDERKLKYKFVRIHAVPDANSALAKANAFENIVRAIVYLLKSLDKDAAEHVTLKVLSECVRVSHSEHFSDDEGDTEDRFIVIEGYERVSNHVQDRMKVEYVMGCVGELLSEMGMQSEETFICMAGVAEVIIELTNRKLDELNSKVDLDVQAALREEEAELEGVRIKSVEMAIAIAGGLFINAYDGSKVKSSLSVLGTVLKKFCILVKSLNDKKRAKLSTALESAEKILDILKSVAIEVCEPSMVYTPTSSSAEMGTKLRGVNTNKLETIIDEMDDPEEAIRGHALIELARYIRKRDRTLLDDIEKNSQLIDIVMKKVADKDSYVYLTAIRAMAEMAYWKRNFFDAMVEFFIDTHNKLGTLLSQTEYKEMMATDKEDFLLIQRVKVAEALGKVCRALGEMAPWHFDRLIGPLMSLVMHADDEQLKASCVCTIADLVVACQGRKISKHLNEMLLMVEQLLGSAKESLLRRAAMVLFRAIIVSFDTSLLEGLSSHLRDLNRHLRHLLVFDRDDGVRLLAELSLLDIKEQMDNAVRDLENSMIKRVRIA